MCKNEFSTHLFFIAKQRKAKIEAARAEVDAWKKIAGEQKLRAEAIAKATEESQTPTPQHEESSPIIEETSPAEQPIAEQKQEEVVEKPTHLLSDEVDENGHPFVLSNNGSTTFGVITEDTGLPPVPIKLSEGFQNKDKKGYGFLHIEANHGEQIKKMGFSSV